MVLFLLSYNSKLESIWKWLQCTRGINQIHTHRNLELIFGKLYDYNTAQIKFSWHDRKSRFTFTKSCDNFKKYLNPLAYYFL